MLDDEFLKLSDDWIISTAMIVKRQCTYSLCSYLQVV